MLTNFMQTPDALDVPGAGRFEVLRANTWPELRSQATLADLIVIDCRDTAIYKLAAFFLLLPWASKPLIAVDLVLRKPGGLRHRLSARLKRMLFKRVHHFIHYFKDLSGYARYFGIDERRSSFVPFKVNNLTGQAGLSLTEEFVFTMGRSLRDYDTFIRAVAQLPFPAAIPAFSFDDFEGKDGSFRWTRADLPANLSVLPDAGSSEDLLRNLARARVVVIPTRADSLCASGLSTYLDAMNLGKCVIVSEGPGASDLLSDQAILVPPHDVEALKNAIRRAWEDEELRKRVGDAGRRYAASLGGEPELLVRIHTAAVRSVYA